MTVCFSQLFKTTYFDRCEGNSSRIQPNCCYHALLGHGYGGRAFRTVQSLPLPLGLLLELLCSLSAHRSCSEEQDGLLLRPKRVGSAFLPSAAVGGASEERKPAGRYCSTGQAAAGERRMGLRFCLLYWVRSSKKRWIFIVLIRSHALSFNFINMQVLMIRTPEIYDYITVSKRHLVIPHRLMPYPEEVWIRDD